MMNDREYNRKMYDTFAEQYHGKRSCEQENLWNLYLDRPMIEQLTGEPSAGSRVLDLGCGSGLLSREFKNKGLDVCGIDYLKHLIRIAQKENSDIEFVVGDVGSTGFPDESFDAVVSGLVMHYIKDLEPVFSEVSRILKSDGIFVFTMHHPFDEVMKIK